MNKIFINTDGGARGNPGPAASAFVIKDDEGNVLFTGQKCLGVGTNNEAEYMAVKIAFEEVKSKLSDKFPLEIEVKADSLLIVNQLSGIFKIKNPRLKVILDEIKILEAEIGKIRYIYIPRAQNFEADALVNSALDNN
jgi:ribonuclease HI